MASGGSWIREAELTLQPASETTTEGEVLKDGPGLVSGNGPELS